MIKLKLSLLYRSFVMSKQKTNWLVHVGMQIDFSLKTVKDITNNWYKRYRFSLIIQYT